MVSDLHHSIPNSHFESVDNAVAGAVMEAALRVYREATDEEEQSRLAKGDV